MSLSLRGSVKFEVGKNVKIEAVQRDELMLALAHLVSDAVQSLWVAPWQRSNHLVNGGDSSDSPACWSREASLGDVSRSSGHLRKHLLHIFHLFVNKTIRITALHPDHNVLVKRQRGCCVKMCASGAGLSAWLPAGKIPGGLPAEEVGNVCLLITPLHRITHRFSAVINRFL